MDELRLTPARSLFAFHPFEPRYAVLECFADEDADDSGDLAAPPPPPATGGLLQKMVARLVPPLPRRAPLDDYERYLPTVRFCNVAAGNGAATAAPLALKHDFMRQVSCVAWSPLSEMLAVGAAHGVCLWRIIEDDTDPDPALTTGWMSFLQHPKKLAIRDLSWSPNGRLLATASPGEAALLVWDVALRTHRALPAPRPLVAVSWSPMGGHLLAAFEGGMFAVWETTRWGVELFDYPGRFCAAAWAPDGLRFALIMDHLDENDRCWYDASPDGDGSSSPSSSSSSSSSSYSPAWTPATYVGEADSQQQRQPQQQQRRRRQRQQQQVRVRLDDANGSPAAQATVVDRCRVFGDKPVFVATIQAREDAAEFQVTFDFARLPAAQDVSPTFGFEAPPLPTSAVQGLAWSADGAVLLASFFLPAASTDDGDWGGGGGGGGGGGRSVGALAAYTIRHEPLSLAPLQLVDMKATPEPPRSASIWAGSIDSSSQLLLGAAWAEQSGVQMYGLPAPQ